MANDHRTSEPDLTVAFLPRSTLRRPEVPVTPPRMSGGVIVAPVLFGAKKETPNGRTSKSSQRRNQ